jgi:hypothetical protein
MLDLAFEPLGRRRLKGVAEPVMLYRVAATDAGRRPVASRLSRSVAVRTRRGGIPVLAGLLAVVVVAVLLGTRVPSLGPAAAAPTATGSAAGSAAASPSRASSPSPPADTSSATPFLPALGAGVKIAIPDIPVVIAATANAVWVARYSGVNQNTGQSTSTLQWIDPVTNQIVATIPLGAGVSARAADGTSLWVALPDANELLVVDGGTNEVGEPISIGEPYDLDIWAGSAWVTSNRTPHQPAFEKQTQLVRVDTKTRKVVSTTELGRTAHQVAATPDTVWVKGDALWRIDPATGRVVATFAVEGRSLAVGAGAVWVIGTGESVLRLDPVLGRIQARIPGPSGGQVLAFAQGSVWVASGSKPATLLQIDPASNRVVSATPFSGIFGLGTAVASGFGSVWLCNSHQNEIWRLQPGG